MAHVYSILQTEHRNAEGRTYWYNTTNKESVWEKPDGAHRPFVMQCTLLRIRCIVNKDLKTPFEVHYLIL